MVKFLVVKFLLVKLEVCPAVHLEGVTEEEEEEDTHIADIKLSYDIISNNYQQISAGISEPLDFVSSSYNVYTLLLNFYDCIVRLCIDV